MLQKFLLLLLFICSPSLFSNESPIQVLVSIAPQKFLVESIGKHEVAVQIIVPTGANSHTYEPTPRQIVAMKQGAIWFRMGESFEERLVRCLPHTLIIDQREGLDLLGCSCCGLKGADPHIWLSPRLLISQAGQIAQTLSEFDPAHAPFYQDNLATLVQELSTLDQEMTLILSDAPKTLLVSHPAYGYLCRDYGLTQLAIEMEGREPTPRYLTNLINQAHALNIETVFLQEQHVVKGSKRIAETLGAKMVYLDPYAENVVENLREIAKAFRQ